MKVEIHINGSNQLQLRPETDLERALLAEMLAASAKGQSVKLISLEDSSGAVVSVGKW